MLCSVARMLELKICKTIGHTDNAILWKRGDGGGGTVGYAERITLWKRGEGGGGGGRGGTVGYTESVIMGEGRGIVGYTERILWKRGERGEWGGGGDCRIHTECHPGRKGERVNLVTYTPVGEVERTNLPWFLGHRAWLLLSTWLWPMLTPSLLCPDVQPSQHCNSVLGSCQETHIFSSCTWVGSPTCTTCI